MKRLIALGFALLAGTAFAVFDLQQVSRFNSSAICATEFDSVAAKAGGQSFVVAGIVSEDLLLVEFDQYGGVIRSALWDSPLVEVQSSPEVHTYADGRVLVAVDRFLIQFSANLTVNWEVEVQDFFKVALDGAGNAYAMNAPVVRRYNASGALLNTTTLSNIDARALKGFPGATGSGVVVVGQDTNVNRGCVIRLGAGLNQVYRAADNLATPGAILTSLDLEADGDVVMGGSRNQDGIFGTLSNAGIIGFYEPAALSFLVLDVKILSSTHAVCSGSFGYVRLDRTTGAVSGTSNVDDGPMAYLTGPSLLALTNSEPKLKVLKGADMTLHDEAVIPRLMRAGAAINPNLAAFVGEREQSGTLLTTDGNGIPGSAAYRFAASPRRTIFDSFSFTDGSVAILSSEPSFEGEKISVARYRSNGTLQLARTLGFAPDDPQFFVAGASSDGSIAIATRIRGSNGWTYSRITSAGAVAASRRIADESIFRPDKVLAYPDGTGLVLGIDSNGVAVVYRMNPAGQILDRVEFFHVDPATRVLDVRSVGVNACAIVLLSDGSASLRLFNPTSLETSATRSTSTNVTGEAMLSRDSAGNILYAYQKVTDLVLERLNPTTLGLLNTRTTPGTSGIRGLAAAPNGNTLCLLDLPTGDVLRYFGPGAFPDVTTVNLALNLDAVDLAVNSTNIAYIVAREGVGGISNVYGARYLATGVRSAQRRTAGLPTNIHIAGGGVWLTGEVGTRKKGWGPFAARYSL